MRAQSTALRAGVPPGVFGSSGNTLLELNGLPTGIQAYAYHGAFVGVTVTNDGSGCP